MSDSVFGVIIELAQRSAFADRDDSKPNNDFYKLISHFDEMRIEIVHTPEEFRSDIGNGHELSDCDLLDNNGEVRKLFFYCISDENQNDIEKQMNYIRPTGKELFTKKPFVALIGIKLCRSYFDMQRETRVKTKDGYKYQCDTYKCIDKILRYHCNLQYLEDYCILRCLGAEDMYLLCRSDSTEKILTTIHELRAFRCSTSNPPDFRCNGKKDSIPVVLETHTHIGYWSTLKVEELSDELKDNPFLFEIQVRQYASANTGSLIGLLKRNGLNDIHKTAGSYGLVARGNITLPQLVSLYNERELDCRKKGHHKEQINYTTGRFLTDSQKGESGILGDLEESYNDGISAIVEINSSFKKLLEEMDSELPETFIDTLLGNIDEDLPKHFLNELESMMEKDLSKTSALNLVTRTKDLHNSTVLKLNKAIIDAHTDYYNSSTTREFASLYSLGCQRLFRTYYWGEYRDILHFFQHYLEHLSGELKQIRIMKVNKTNGSNESEHYRKHIFQSIDLFNQNMSVVLNDRLMMGRSMQENVRQSVYATGAYEDLIQFYRVFIYQLRALFNKIVDKEAPTPGFVPMYFHFLFVPKHQGPVKSDDLFPYNYVPLSEVKHGTVLPQMLQIVSFIHMSATDLWNFQYSMVLLCHEIGHYLFLYNRKSMRDVFVNTTARLFINDLIIKLRDMYYPSAPEGMVGTKAKELYKALTDYLNEKLPQDLKHFKNLDNSIRDVESLICNAIENQFTPSQSGYANHKIRKISEDKDGFIVVQKILSIYDSFDLLPMMSMNSYGFSNMIFTIISNSCQYARSIIAECRADLFALSVLDIDLETYVRYLVQVQNSNDAQIFDDDEAQLADPVSSIRLLNVIFHDYLRTLRISKKETPNEVNDINQDEFYAYYDEKQKSLKKTFKSNGRDLLSRLLIIVKGILDNVETNVWSQIWHLEDVDRTLLIDMLETDQTFFSVFNNEDNDKESSPSCKNQVDILRGIFLKAEVGDTDQLKMLEPMMRFMHDYVP